MEQMDKDKNDRLVSIVVPVYNAGRYISQTIDSVIKQTYKAWELILVDDCSGDDSREIAGEYCLCDPRIQLVKKSVNEGAAKARNTGLSCAGGRYIAFLDADDIWLPDKLEAELDFMEKTGAAFAFTSYVFGDEGAQSTGRIVHAPDKLDYRAALSRTVIFTSTVMVDMTLLPRELVRMPDVKSEDTATWWSILKTGRTACGLDRVLVIYRRPAGSLSSNKLEAARRIWNLYRRVEGLPAFYSLYYFLMWAVRATLRRL